MWVSHSLERGRDDLLPGVYFERDFVKFASDIGAEINMDFV